MIQFEPISDLLGRAIQHSQTSIRCLILAGLVAMPLSAQEARVSEVDPVMRNPQLTQAIEDLAQRESISSTEIEVISVEEVVWPDSSLGCPQPGMRYRQVLQDGMRIILQAGGRQYAYHSGGKRAPFLCKHKSSKVPAESGERLTVQDKQPN